MLVVRSDEGRDAISEFVNHMRFFTRDKLDAVQLLDAHSGEADFGQSLSQSEWARAGRDYRNYLQSVSSKMSEPAKALAALDLHDYRVLAATQVGARVELLFGSPWKKPRFREGHLVSVSGVTECVGARDALGQDVVAHEVVLNVDNSLEMYVLLDETEVFLQFREVIIEGWKARR